MDCCERRIEENRNRFRVAASGGAVGPSLRVVEPILRPELSDAFRDVVSFLEVVFMVAPEALAARS
jgi:hypothetical protein